MMANPKLSLWSTSTITCLQVLPLRCL